MFSIALFEETENVKLAKKKYFAMIDELARFAGYLSYDERQLFKAQVKETLGGESIAEMTDPLQIQVKIEELTNFAMRIYEYTFNPFSD